MGAVHYVVPKSSQKRLTGRDRTTQSGGKQIKTIVCFSDTHCGSRVGMLPPGATTVDGDPVAQSDISKWLWEQWLDCWQEVALEVGAEQFAMAIVGDTIQGAKYPTQLYSIDPSDHAKWAFEVVAPLCHHNQADKVEHLWHAPRAASREYVVTGTESHTGPYSEHALAAKIGAVPDGKRSAWDVLDVDYGGYKTRFVHEIPATTRKSLQFNQLGINLAEHQLAAAVAGHIGPRVLVAGHRHEYGMVKDARRMCITLPPWQGSTRYGYRGFSSRVAECGMVILQYEREGQLPHVVEIMRSAEQRRSVAL